MGSSWRMRGGGGTEKKRGHPNKVSPNKQGLIRTTCCQPVIPDRRKKKGKKWSTSTGTCGGGTEEPAVELWRSFLFFLILPFRPILFAHHLASWLSVKKVSEHGGAGQVDNISDISPDRRWRWKLIIVERLKWRRASREERKTIDKSRPNNRR